LSGFKRLLRLLPLVLVAGALSGCATILGGTTPATLYGLNAPTDYPVTYATPSWQLMVEEPLAERALDTDRIAIYTGPHALQYFTAARWTDRAPRMVQDLIVESFEHAGLQLSAGRQTMAVRPNVALISDLRALEAVLEPSDGDAGAGKPVARVRISAKLVSLDGRAILAGRTFEAKEVAASDAVEDVVLALNVAMQGMMRELVVWAAAESSYAADAKAAKSGKPAR